METSAGSSKTTRWNLGWDEDVHLSDVEWENESESKEVQQIDYNEFYLEPKRPLEKPEEESGVTHFLTKNFRLKDCNSSINFAYIHDQDMNYYQEPTSYYHGNFGHDSEVRDFNQTSMLGDIPEPGRSEENGLDYDPDYDEEVNKLLEEVEEELKEDTSELKVEVDKTIKADRDRYEDFYDEFAPEEPVCKIPSWYSTILQKKQQEAIERLRSLSLLVGYASPKAWEHMKRVEQDHHTPFCKINPPKHPPINKPWQNYWRFNCAIKCSVDPPEPNHAHTADCEEILLEHSPTLVSTKSKNIIPMEFPKHVMRTVELFQDFINSTSKDNPYLYSDEIPDTVYEKPTWCYIKMRSNYKNEIMMIVCGKGVTPLLGPLKKLFKQGAGRTVNVTSLWCINIRWSQKRTQFPPTYLYGEWDLRDKIGPITINYTAKNNISFNAVEAEQLGRIMMEYLNPTAETTVIDIGCNFGALSLMLATKCEKVIGLNTSDTEIKFAEELKLNNTIHNASFITCTPKDVHTKCSSLVKKCISVAVLNLSTPFGKSADVMKSLRNLPSLWRVALYGTFTKEFQKHITILTSSDHHMGEEFLPMQGCVLERSPSVPKEFSIIVVFERKSLIEPSIELIGCGPTVNVKEDLDCNSVKPVRIPDVKTSEIVGRGYGKFRQYDSPALPKSNKDIDKDVKPVVEPPQTRSIETTNLLPPDYGKPGPKKPVIDIAKLYDPTPNPAINRQLKKIYDSPLLPRSSDSTNPKIDNPSLPKSSIKTEPTTSSTISTDPRCDFLDELKPSLTRATNSFDFLNKSKSSLPISTDPRCDFLDELKPSLTRATNSFDFLNKSKSSLPISTDPRCDFLGELKPFKVKQEPFDQKKVPVHRKERNHVSLRKPKNDKRFDYSSISVKKEKYSFSWSSSSQNSNSRSPPIKKEPLIEAQTQSAPKNRAFEIPLTFKTETVESQTQPAPTNRAFEILSTFKTETVESLTQSAPTNGVFEIPPTFKTETEYLTIPVKRKTQFDNPPLPEGLPPEYCARPPNYTAPPPDFSVPPPGFNVKTDFNIPPPLPKAEHPVSSIEKEEGELSLDSNNDNLLEQVSNASSNPDVFFDAIVKPEPMDLDDDDEENLPQEPRNDTVKSNTFVKLEEVTPNHEPMQTFPAVRIKSEPIDPNELPNFTSKLPSSTELHDSTELPVRIKAEPVDTDEIVTTAALPTPTYIKQERASPTLNAEDLMSMPTPIHNPAALAERDRDSSSPPPASANFKTIDGFEFSVQPNQSYMIGTVSTSVKAEPRLEEGELENENTTLKSEPSQKEPATVIVKQEEMKESSEKAEGNPPVIRVKKFDTFKNEENEISIISEKKSKKAKKEKSKSKSKSESKKDLKKGKERRVDPDMRLLIEEKKKLKKILKRQISEYDRSLSPSPDRRSEYRSPSTNRDRDRSPPAAYKRSNRSLPLGFDRWLQRPSSPRERYLSRSPSPRERWSRRSPFSPTPSRRWNRLSSSSSETEFRRSPSLSSDRRFRHSPSVSSDRRFRRSPLSPSNGRYKRSPPSPSERRFRRSSTSPSARRFKRSSRSPSNRQWRRSPTSFSSKRSKRSTSPFGEGDSMYNRKTKPLVRKYSESAYGDFANSRYKWTRKSPSIETTENRVLKKKPLSDSDSKKRKSLSLETSEFEKNKSRSKTDDQWDIPAIADLSSFSDSTTSSPDKRKRIKRETSPADSVSSSASTTTAKVETTSLEVEKREEKNFTTNSD